MTPSQVAASLSKIAARIENSKQPQVSEVVRDLSEVLSEIDTPQVRKAAWKVSGPAVTVRPTRVSTKETCRKIAGLMVRLAEDNNSPWDLDDGERTEAKWKEARGENEKENLESKLKLLKRQIDKFIEVIKHGEFEEEDLESIVSPY
jgi:hypothetical protein